MAHKIVVIGLGYVGLPLAHAFSEKYDAILTAVGHKMFTEFSRRDYEDVSTNEPVLIDIKGIVEDPTWRL